MDIVTRTIGADQDAEHENNRAIGALLDSGYKVLSSATSEYDGLIYITLVMAREEAQVPATLEAKAEPVSATMAIKKSEWDATQTHIGFLVNTIYDIHQALDTYARTLPGTSVGGARLIAEMCAKAETRQLEFEAERGE